MDNARREALLQAGIDIDSTLERFMNNEALMERFWQKFPNDKSYAELMDAIAADDKAKAITSIHTFKGVCGTLGFTEMYKTTVQIESLMRSGQWDEALNAMPMLEKLYRHVCSVIGD